MAQTTRAPIGRQDLGNYDGRNPTFQRPSNTGGIDTLLAIGGSVDVVTVYGGGVNRNAGAIQDAINAAGTSVVIFSFAPGTWDIDADITIPSNVFLWPLPGVIFSMATGKTLTVNSPEHLFASPILQIFTGGTVAFTNLGTIYPEWWGAKADGSTADTTAIQSAFTVGGTVWFTKGRTYKTDQVNLTVAETRATGGGAISQKTTGALTGNFNLQAQDVEIDSLRFEGLDQVDTADRAIYWSSANDRANIHDNFFTNYNYGIHVDGSALGAGTEPTHSNIHDNIFDSMGTSSANTHGWGIKLDDVRHFNVKNNIFKSVNIHAVHLAVGTSRCLVSNNNIETVTTGIDGAIKIHATAAQDACLNNVVSNNLISGSSYGIVFKENVNYNVARGNKIKLDSTGFHLYLLGSDSAASGDAPFGNVLEGNDFQGTAASAIKIIDADQSIIRNNTGEITTVSGEVISITDDGTWAGDDWVAQITNNTVRTDADTRGIELNYTANTHEVHIDGNDFPDATTQIVVTNGELRGYHDSGKWGTEVNLPTGATPSVAGFRAGRTANSGATSITAFLDGFPGQIITIYGDDAGNTTVNDGASLSMPGGSNKLLANDDVLMLVCEDGTIWHAVSLSDNTP